MLSTNPFLWKETKLLKNSIKYLIFYIASFYFISFNPLTQSFFSINVFYVMIIVFMAEVMQTFYEEIGPKIEVLLTIPYTLAQIIQKKMHTLIIKLYIASAIIYVPYLLILFIKGRDIPLSFLDILGILILGYFLNRLGYIFACIILYFGKKMRHLIMLIQIVVCFGFITMLIIIKPIILFAVLIILSVVLRNLYKPIVNKLNNEYILKGAF